LIRFAQPFLAKLKLTIYWSLSQKGLTPKKQHSRAKITFAAEKMVFYDVPMGRYKKIFLADRRIHLGWAILHRFMALS